MKISYSRLKASLGRALELPAPDRGQVIRACGRLEERLRAGASDLSEAMGYGTQQLYAAADLLGREALEARVERELGELERQFQVLPLGVLFHISAGNVPGLGAYSVLEGLLTGNVNFLKPSGRDGGVSAFLLNQLVAEEPGLRPFIHVFPFPSSSQDKIRRLASLADAVVMWGGSEAVASVRQLTPPDTRLIEWGHKFSFAYVTAEGMRDEAGLRRLAGHIRGTRQRYCSSCQGIFLDTADIGVAKRFRERFGRVWEEAARAGDPGKEPPANRFGSPLKGFLPEDVARRTVEAYTVNLEDSLYRPTRTGGCFLARLPWGQILTGLRPLAGSIQTAGLLCGAGEWEAYSRRLLRAGATRVCPVEEMSEPAGLISHDGELALRRYCKVVGVRQGVRQQPEGPDISFKKVVRFWPGNLCYTKDIVQGLFGSFTCGRALCRMEWAAFKNQKTHGRSVMRQWKRLLALSLGLTLTFGQAAYGEIIIPPIPTTGIAGTAGAEAPAGTAAAPVAPGQAAQTPAQTGAGLASGVGAGTVSGAGPATSQAPAVGQAPSGGQAPAVGQVPSGGQAPATGQTSSSDQSRASSAEPVVVAEGAVLMDGSSGKVLYGKNENQQFYPASITKIMTALVVLERCKLSDVVTFTASATSNLESGAVSLNITEGDKLTVEQCLYGLLLKSANEIGNGLAEHVAGSVSAFADLMNAKAAELGCKNTHFANPHGLNDSTHKTTPYDMALIMRAALQNATFRKIDTTTSYNFPATKKAAARTITMGHKMMYPTDSRYYEGIIGGKTGYTSKAGNTLVTAVEKNGVRLVAVVMKASGTQYTDTKALLDYGFGNYAALTGGESGVGPSAGSGGSGAGPGVGSGTGSGAATGTAASAAPAATKSASEPAGGQADTMRPGWNRNGNSWYYIKNDGTQAANEWQTVDGEDYWFDGSGYMATGWRKFTNGDWYYFAPDSGHMVKSSWVEDGGAWYYLGKDGVLLTNTTTPDGYPVDGNGIWIQG